MLVCLPTCATVIQVSDANLRDCTAGTCATVRHPSYPISYMYYYPAMYDLRVEIRRLNHTSGFSYRIMLAGVLAAHGREAVVKELTASHTGNVVSIAAASNWCKAGPKREASRARAG